MDTRRNQFSGTIEKKHEFQLGYALCLGILFFFMSFLPLPIEAAKKEPVKEAVEPIRALSELKVDRLTVSLKSPKKTKGYRVEAAVPALSGDLIVVGNTSGELVALNQSTGASLWRVSLGAPIEGEPLIDDDLIFVGNNEGIFQALNRRDGSKVWEISLYDELLGRPILFGGDVLVVTARDRLLRFDRATGERKDAVTLSSFTPDISLRGQGVPLLVGSTVFVPLAEGALVAYDLSARAIRFKQAFRSGNTHLTDSDVSPFLLAGSLGRAIYTGSAGTVQALDITAGTPIWQRPLSTFTDAVQDGDYLYLPTARGEVYALNARDGSVVWRQRLGGKMPAVLTNVVTTARFIVVGDRDMGLYVLDKTTGVPQGKVSVSGGVSARLISDATSVYFVSNAHRLHRIRL